MNYDDAFNNIQLEPRLREYSRKKEFNKKNKIRPGISEEQEFNITREDLITINNKTIKNNTQNTDQFFIKPVKFEFTDYSKEFNKDPRYMRMQKKSATHKKTQEQVKNMDGVYMLNSKDFMLNGNKQYMQMNKQTPQGLEHRRSVNDIIGNMDTYNKHLNKSYDYVDDVFDIDARSFTPGYNTETKRDVHTSYNTLPFGYGNGLADITVENSLKNCHRDTSKKTTGFRNPFENQFQYISSDISNPDHTVQMWPENTRGQNKEVRR